MKTALYVRVGTSNNGQDPMVQLRDLREYAERRGWTVAWEYVDTGISGTKEKRPELDRLMADAHLRRFDCVVVWKSDRFARSVSHLLRAESGHRHICPRTSWLREPTLFPSSAISMAYLQCLQAFSGGRPSLAIPFPSNPARPDMNSKCNVSFVDRRQVRHSADVAVVEKQNTYRVKTAELKKWLARSRRSPRELVEKRLKEMLDGERTDRW